MITTAFLTVIGLALVAIVLTAALSPIETLSWWAGWTEEEIKDEAVEDEPVEDARTDKLFIVYLSGIASISGRYLIKREKNFIKNLKARLPDATVIADVFPYSPSGLPLLESPRVFDRVWRWVQKLKLQGHRTLLAVLINFRNVFQVMISADHRYGPIFNQGAAQVIETALRRAGYKSGAPIAIIGYSGGGQIAVGAATFLSHRLKAPIDVISIGGVMASDPGLHFVRHLHHLVGDGDNIEKIGAAMFPERWAAMAHSEWNTGKRHGRIILHRMKNMVHSGVKGYFGMPRRDGVSNSDRTLDLVASILTAPSPSTTPAP